MEERNKKDVDEFVENISSNFKTYDFKMCYNWADYGKCYRDKCPYVHDYAKLNVHKCKWGSRCSIRNCRFIHPYENNEEYYNRIYGKKRKYIDLDYDKPRNYFPNYSPRNEYNYDYPKYDEYQPTELCIKIKREFALNTFKKILDMGEVSKINMTIID